jgi:dihydrofolate synthase/folylpolyglutamate synthase
VFDATNVVLPEVCLLTSISYDHTEVLGKTLKQIATEKCGIIKSGCAVVSHPQMEEAERVIQQTCLEKEARLISVGRDVSRKSLNYNPEFQELEVKGLLDSYRIKIPLLGSYQMDNAAAAVAALEILKEKGYQITREAILAGLAQVELSGRMQVISRKPLIVMDGGHNPGAAHGLKEALKQYFKPARAILVFGASNDKDISGVIKELVPVFDTVIATQANNPRSVPPETLVKEFSRQGIQARPFHNIAEALLEAKVIAGEEDLICVTGSLFVVGEAIEYVKGYSDNL